MNQDQHEAHSTGDRPCVTVATVLWVLVAAVALTLRLTNLGAAPLSAAEAHEAVLAWRAVNGRGMPQTDYAPLLFAANALLFLLCDASDALARLWPALLGSALALTPLLLQRRVGRVGALAAGLYLAVSPTALIASRQVDGAVLAAAGGMLLLGGLVRFWDTDRRFWLTLAAGGLALAVTSSPLAYGLILSLGLAWLLTNYAVSDASPLGSYISRLAPHLSHFFLVFVIAVLILATGLGWNWGGIGAAGDVLAAWFARFRPAPHLAASPLMLLIAYEPLAVLFGLGGVVWAVRRGRVVGVLLGLWWALGFLLLLLMPGRAPLDALWTVLPLAMLVGLAANALARRLRGRGEVFAGESSLGVGVVEGVYVLVVLVLWAHFYLTLARYALDAKASTLTLALLSLFLQFFLFVSFVMAIDLARASRTIAASTGVALLAFSLSIGWGAAHACPADPRGVLVRQPTETAVRDLVRTLRELSWRRTGLPTSLAFTYEAAPDSVLAWYLRDFSSAERVDHLGDLADGDAPPVLIGPAQELTLTSAEGYVGQDVALTREHWLPRDLGCSVKEWPARCSVALSWWLYREAGSLPEADRRAVIWVREE